MQTRTFGFIVLPIAIAGLAWEIKKAMAASATAKWTKVPCVITSIESLPQSSSISDEERFELRAHYTYEIDGKTFRSSKIANSHCEHLSHSEASSLMARIPTGDSCHAYYNPMNPDDSVLLAGHDRTNIKELAIWIIAIPFSIMFILKG